MGRTVGTVVRGVRMPVIVQGDDLCQMAVECLLDCAKQEQFEFNDRDVVAITEAVVARAQGNYANIDQIAADIKKKFPGGELAVAFPILSRNRFATMLSGIARGAKKVLIALSFPRDEVGNALFDEDALESSGKNMTDTFDIAEYRKSFGNTLHPFTGIDYVEFYEKLVTAQGAEVAFVFTNSAAEVVKRCPHVLVCDIHERARTKRRMKAAGAASVVGLDQILTASVDGSGFNPEFGLLGSNKATDERVKLFPRDGQPFVERLAAELKKQTGKQIEVMIYGDGAFKDSVAKVWELADPVVSPAYTSGLEGTPNELKLKYLADNSFADLRGEELTSAIKGEIRAKEGSLVGSMLAQGTTPRKITDLIGSLCDLTSGSGDKGTPMILIQGYFDNFSH